MSSTARGKLDKWNRNSSNVKSLTKIAILLMWKATFMT